MDTLKQNELDAALFEQIVKAGPDYSAEDGDMPDDVKVIAIQFAERIRADERAKAEKSVIGEIITVNGKKLIMWACIGAPDIPDGTEVFTRPPIQSELEQELRAEIERLKDNEKITRQTFER